MKKLYTILLLIPIVYFMVGCQNNKAMAELLMGLKAKAEIEEQNLELVSKLWVEWNERNLKFFMDVNAPDFAFYSPSGNPNHMSLEETIERVKMIWEAFPDITVNVEETMVARDKIISKMIYKGTHDGEFCGIPATGNKFEISGINIIRIKNGKIVEEWEAFDMLGLMMQLGMELKPKE